MLERALFAIVLMLFAVVIFVYHAAQQNKKTFLGFLSGCIAGVVFTLALFLIIMPVKPTTEYVPAVIACQNEFSTYFYDVSSGHIYHVETKPGYMDDCPYLLDIETHGTESKLDDEVLVVWRTD